MDKASSKDIEKIRQQYESLPYPHYPLEAHPKDKAKNLDLFFAHSLATAYYLRDQTLVDVGQRVILDAGCGSGYKALYLAEANPGAKIVGVDLSPESIRWARQRFEYHGIENAEFHVASLEDLPALGLTFDYINCDEVLYLLPDPLAGLKAMKAALSADGIIRTNLHSLLQRARFFRAQDLFRMMGLMEDNPGEMEVSIVRETMGALKNQIDLKHTTWDRTYETEEASQRILMNHLLQGDRGYTIPQMFEMLRAADLEFISMVDWRNWELISLFKEPENLPAVWAMSLPGLSAEEQLRIYELLHPYNRLLDFWCDSGGAPAATPLADWSPEDWQSARVSLHPLLKTSAIQQQVENCVREGKAFGFHEHISISAFGQTGVDSRVMAVLLPLWQAAQPFAALVSRFQSLYPYDPVTLNPTDERVAFEFVQDWVKTLEVFLYLLVEKSPA
ncbi:MAG: class I SAM-dependent methyltransferase [Elainellaceae cyanobacterium]